MTTVSAVSFVMERVQTLLLAEGAPARCEGELHRKLSQLLTQLSDIKTIRVNKIAEGQIRQLALEIEDAVESYALPRPEKAARGCCACAFGCLFKAERICSPERGLLEDLDIFVTRIQEIKPVIVDERGEIKSSNNAVRRESRVQQLPAHRSEPNTSNSKSSAIGEEPICQQSEPNTYCSSESSSSGEEPLLNSSEPERRSATSCKSEKPKPRGNEPKYYSLTSGMPKRLEARRRCTDSTHDISNNYAIRLMNAMNKPLESNSDDESIWQKSWPRPVHPSNETSSSGVEPKHSTGQQQVDPNHVSIPTGMEDDAIKLKSYLVYDQEQHGNNNKLSIIAVCGMGGIGKTTLARNAYNDPFVVQHFDIRAWANVGMEFQARDVLENILLCLSGSPRIGKHEIAEMETMELMYQLLKAQKGKRYVVVLDDVWSTEAWDTLKYAFRKDDNGSRVVVTTRNMALGRNIASSLLQMQPLTDEQSWEFLKHQSGFKDDGETEEIDLQVISEIEKIGRQIAKYCGGLPLALTVIGSSLKGVDLGDWDLMLQTLLEGHTSQPNLEAAKDILALSYNNLPHHLMPCFLYVGLFPPQEAISVEKLCLLWMAEGLILTRAQRDQSRIKYAEDELYDLVSRSLVIAVEEKDVPAPRRLQSFKVNDLIRDHCISKGKQELFVEIIDFQHESKISSLSRRLAIYLNKYNEDTNDLFLNITEVKQIRSILFFDTFGCVSKSTWPKELSDLESFEGTRVLDFDGVDFRVKKLPRGIDTLRFLRYLSFAGCHLHEFPSSFTNFPFLETLDLRVQVSCIMTIPNILNKLSSLRHLYFPAAYRCDTKDKLKLDRLRELEVLENFHSRMCDIGDLMSLQKLGILTGIVDGNNMDLSNIIIYVNMNKEFLSYSSLVIKNFDSYSKERLSLVATLLESTALCALDIEGYLGVFPRNDRLTGSLLTHLVFDGSEFNEDPMPLLGKLPNLNSLALCTDAFVGTKMVCSESDFPELKSLKLSSLQCLEKWEMKGDDVMPLLTILTIELCHNLETLPDGLIKLRRLEKIMIGSMPESFQDGVNRMVEEMRKLRSPEMTTVTFYNC